MRDFLFCPHTYTRPTTNLQGKEKGNGTVYQNYVPDKTTRFTPTGGFVFLKQQIELDSETHQRKTLCGTKYKTFILF